MTDLKPHPVAALFPMLPDDDLAAMAEDIKQRGQLQPIIVWQGQILDGRNRYAACKLAGVPAATETYEGDDPAGYALAANIHRRSLRPSQRNMIAEQARRLTGRSKVTIVTSEGQRKGMVEAATVLDHAPHLASQVVDGSLPLYKAVDAAREEKRAKGERAKQEARVRADAPDLAERLDDETDALTLAEAVTLLDARQSEAQRERVRQEQEQTAAVGRYVEALRLFLAGWDRAANLADDPNRDDVLAALGDYDRARFLEIEKRIT